MKNRRGIPWFDFNFIRLLGDQKALMGWE